MLHRFGMKNYKSVKLPILSSELTKSNKTRSEEKRFSYREPIGCLNYITMITRPDIL